jgi:two-component system cell cycle sensor histidine kinase/response regulator CckA
VLVLVHVLDLRWLCFEGADLVTRRSVAIGNRAQGNQHTQASASGAALDGSETVLVVDDEAPLRELICEALEASGYTARGATGAEQAMEIVESSDKLDLLLTDVGLPTLGGPELANQLEALRPGLKVLFISGYTDDAIVPHGVLPASRAFLQKPFTIDALLRKVRGLLDHPAGP